MEGNGDLKVDVSCVFKCNKCANSDSMLHEMMCVYGYSDNRDRARPAYSTV